MQQQSSDHPDKDFMVCGIDLISGIVDGLEANALPLITNSNLINLLFQCMKVVVHLFYFVYYNRINVQMLGKALLLLLEIFLGTALLL